MTLYQILTLFGVPSLLMTLFGYILGTIKQIRALKKGLQALLRDRLIENIYHYIEKGYAPLHARDSLHNMHEQYQSLGKNGVMDDLWEDFLKLPVMEPSKDYTDG